MKSQIVEVTVNMRSLALIIAYILFLCNFLTNAVPVPSVDTYVALGYRAIPGTDGVYLYNKTLSTREDAEAACKSDGTSLFFPEDEDEFNAVIQHFERKIENFPKYFHLGMRGSDNEYFTANGTHISNVYNKWVPEEPSMANVSEACVQAWRKNNVWGLDDIECNEEVTFICKAPVKLDKQVMDCSLFGYTYFEQLGKCYKLHLTPKSWNQARIVCQEEKSDLAVINSHEEAAYLVRLANKVNFHVPGNFTRGVILLGFHKEQVEDWQTVQVIYAGVAADDSGYTIKLLRQNGKIIGIPIFIDGINRHSIIRHSMNYSGYPCWGNRQPDGGDDDKCGSMFYNGHLNDIDCDREAFFICEHVIHDPYIISEPDALTINTVCYNSI